ncbi:MarR family winged helix-turn-helix transcriptional regulator [Nocardioides sp. B-3]|uniref:MarR family winged helix-turn-helix transcriptional regulator n=1 Tax=Nocardioides sp. B-3 TaxID=2895565 RepID=UPI002153A64D|nr:MarR family transcriptional regulator [Nocardioides sp. B-3]UUZ61778.1 MarR family transcriptional regulator [Nocardioides sp. B-3]
MPTEARTLGGLCADRPRRFPSHRAGTRANMSPQAMGEFVDELEELGYVVRRPDPTDRRAKLITLTSKGQACIAAGIATIDGIEQQLTARLGERGHAQLRSLLAKLLEDG